MKNYKKTLAKMESEVKRAKAHVTMLKMLYKAQQQETKKEKVRA